ncbi:MAG: phenylalanine--tRNA ligase subunit beta, partial [Dehalococcoidales bacterium]|nr:phenylalanine--tRNA ligase subunit beta [Dehalococcoidales bacterium]
MKVSLNWLKEYVDITLSHSDIANKLTMAGLEVKEVEIIGGQWENIIVGQITAVNPHPGADRLRLVTVDFAATQETVVCGAPNCQVNDKIAFARVGAEISTGNAGEHTKLKSVKIRGVVSNGMICSEKELGISDNHEGILVLLPDAPVGMPLVNYMGDTVFNLEVTPNRPDCLSVIGIAREIAALTGESLRLPEISYAEIMPSAEQAVTVEIP